MKRTSVFRTVIIAMAVALTFALCACGNAKNGTVSSEVSSEAASQSELTPEQQVEKLLLEEFTRNYGDNLEKCVFGEIIIYTAQDIADNQEMFGDYNFMDTDIVFAAHFDLKAPDGKDVMPLLPANGIEDGQWVRNKYVCGYLSLDSEGEYELTSWGTAF